MGRYVNIMIDQGFKAVFGDEQVAIQFLNAVLEGERKIQSITYLDKEIQPEYLDGRTIIFDLLCEDVDGTRFVLEMQNCPQPYFFNRGFYYLCRMISKQGCKGRDWEYDLLPVYGVYLLNFMLPSFTDYRTDVVLADKRTGKPFEEIKMTQIYVSLPLFELREDECKTAFERWIFTLKHMDIFDKSPFKEDKLVFDRLLDVASVEALDERERAIYEENLKRYRDWRGAIKYAVNEGIERGKKEGREAGRVEGKAEGIAEGEALTSSRFVVNMKKAGLDEESIARIGNISLEEVQAILEKDVQ